MRVTACRVLQQDGGVTARMADMPVEDLSPGLWERLGADLSPDTLATMVDRVVPLRDVLEAAPLVLDRQVRGAHPRRLRRLSPETLSRYTKAADPLREERTGR